MQEHIDFLGTQSPYDRLPVADLATLARRVEVEFFAAGTVIVQAHGPELSHLYVVRTGIVHVLDGDTVVDELVAGDTFGHLSLLSGLPPPLSVRAETEVLVYRLPDPRPLIGTSDRLKFAHYNAMLARPRLTGRPVDAGMRPVSEFVREPLWCEAFTPVREAAALMTNANQSCVLFREGSELGILTDSDCRRLVATGVVGIDAPIREVGTVPARTVSAATHVSAAFVEMVSHGVHHLAVSSPSGQVVGVTRVVDLSASDIRDPLMIRSAIDRAETAEELSDAAALLPPTICELFDSGLPALRLAGLIGAIMEAVLQRCIHIEPFFSHEGSSRASWLLLGSLARHEPMPLSDVDTGMVWHSDDDPALGARPFLDAAERVLDGMEHAGLRRCEDGANATNPLFNRSDAQWISSARRWIAEPDREGALLLSGIVTDSRPLTGVQLGRSTLNGIDRLATNKRFLKRMLDETLATRPPTGFVRDFVVESNGTHQGQLDLKKRGIGPVVAIGRWISVTLRMPATSTQDRLAQGAAAGLLTRDEADTLRSAHREMFELLFGREVESLRHRRAGSTFVDPQELDTLTRRHLRESFRAIAKVQVRLEGEWISRIR